MTVILETARLQLRELTSEDLDFMATMLADPEVMRFYPKCYSRLEAQKWLERCIRHYKERGYSFWLVLNKKTRERLGQVGLLSQTITKKQEIEVAYMIHRPFWGRAYGTEAAWGVRDLAFRQKKVSRLVSLIRPENKPSRVVAEKLGFVKEEEMVSHGSLEHLVYSMTRRKWQEQPGYGLVEERVSDYNVVQTCEEDC